MNLYRPDQLMGRFSREMFSSFSSQSHPHISDKLCSDGRPNKLNNIAIPRIVVNKKPTPVTIDILPKLFALRIT